MTAPKLRFREFYNDWLANNLGEVCSHFQSGKSITSKNINDSHGFPVYGGNGLRGFTDTFTHEGKFVLVGRQGALCGNVNLVDGINYISEHAIAIQANTDNSTDLLAYWLDKMKLNRFSEASAQPGLAVKKLVKFKIILPTLKEQTKIASFLSSVDDKIAQLTQEHELLSEYKKGMMQQLFSQKIRFQADDGSAFEDWKNTRLGKACSHFQSGKSITAKDISDSGSFPVYGGNGLRGFTDQFTHEGEFILVGRQGALCGNVNLVDGPNYISEHAIAIQVNLENSNKWLAYWLDKMKLNRFSEASAQPGLAVNKLVRFEINLPQKEEQTKIANFLSAIDQKIDNVAAQIDQAKEWKKGLLQQMFV